MRERRGERNEGRVKKREMNRGGKGKEKKWKGKGGGGHI